MGYQSLVFNGNEVLAYVDSPTPYELKENDIIYVMPLDLYFKVTNKKMYTMQLKEDEFGKVKNTQLRNYGVLKFKLDENEIFIERKTHLLLEKVKVENGIFVKF
ncbi:MAG: hypothetical protein PHG81_06385 [Aliarcobacter sp.]|nr:hypothetical protein [Aliarcobacter sp.]